MRVVTAGVGAESAPKSASSLFGICGKLEPIGRKAEPVFPVEGTHRLRRELAAFLRLLAEPLCIGLGHGTDITHGFRNRRSIPPKVLKPIRRQLGVANRTSTASSAQRRMARIAAWPGMAGGGSDGSEPGHGPHGCVSGRDP
jgi:hypothetical protein